MKALVLSIVSFCSFSLFCQVPKEPMKLIGTQILQGDMPITLGMARSFAMSESSEAYMHFQKASKIRGWNVFRGVFGSLEVLGGLNSVAVGNSLGLIDLGLGTACIVSIFPRENNRRAHLMMGIKAYNASIE